MTDKQAKTYKYHLLAIITATIWGTTLISTKVLIWEGVRPTEIFFYRFLMAYVAIWFVSPKILWAKNIKDEFSFLLLGLFGGSFYFITENIAIGITQTNNVALILCTAPLITALLSIIFYKEEKLTSNLIFGSILAFIGVALVIFNGSFVLELNPLGDFLTLLSASSWAIYSLMMRRLEGRYPVLFVTRKVFFYGLVTLIPLILMGYVGFNKELLLKPPVIFNLLFLGLIASMLCFIMWNIALKELGTVRTSNYIYLIPLVTLITSALVLNERITLIGLIGSVCILLGVYVAEKGIKIFKK